MDIGETLAAARRQAGLTITQVSQRTCIRETIVRGIERGDYSACGGDFYARGHIRSIARAVGLDPEELIREYDATQAPPQPITAAEVFQPYTPVKLKERRRPNWSIVLLAGLIAVLGIVGFKYFGSRSNPKSPSAASSGSDLQSKKPTHSATTPAAQPSPLDIRVTVVALPGGVSWAEETTQARGVIFLGDIGGATGPGKVSETETDAITVQLGNPAGVTVYLNGKRQHMEQTNPIKLICTQAACTPS